MQSLRAYLECELAGQMLSGPEQTKVDGSLGYTNLS